MASTTLKISARLAAIALLALLGTAGAAMAKNSGPGGFGINTTGGDGGDTVHVTTPAQLRNELCRSLDAAGYCNDDAPRIVVVDRTIDFRGLEGSAMGLGCHPYSNKSEALLLLNSSDTRCNDFVTSQIQYDKVGRHPIMVGSNKSLVGTGTSGIIKGTGLRLLAVRNVIIRNVTIRDINPSVVFAGDAINLAGVDNVWIDHNWIAMIGRQMIAGDFDSLTHITISWNEFDGRTPYASGGDGNHYWNMLFETGTNSTQSITIANNWIHNFAARAPIATGNGVIQIVNNYFQTGSGHALHAYSGINALLEGNYFDQVRTPVLKNTQPSDVGSVFAVVGSNNDTASICFQYINRKCGNNIVMGARDQSGLDHDQTVLKAVKNLLPLKTIEPSDTSTIPAVVKAQAGPGHI
ncbi:pectin/pectate lyase [Xanthomonas arboricola]|nr:pectin/pectate lyase [Xanthomonas arboricola]